VRLLAALLLCLPHVAAAQEDESSTIMGRSSAGHLQFAPAGEMIAIAAGSRLRLQPDLESPLLEILGREVIAPLVDRRQGWVRVRVGAWQGWVLEEGVDSGPLTAPGLATRAATVRFERLHRLLGEHGREVSLGPYRLITDVPAGEMLERLSRLADHLGDAYRERFGIDPGPAEGEIFALFADEADYRLFESEDLEIADLQTAGHTVEVIVETTRGTTVSTLASTFVGERSASAVEQVLVHEMTHVLTRRISGTPLPPWLEEGMAEDLAISRIDSDSRLEPGSWSGSSYSRSYQRAGGGGGVSRRLDGGRAALAAVLATWRRPARTDLETLTRLPRAVIVAPQQRSQLYAESAMLVRFLLDGAGDQSATRFRRHLAALIGGSSTDLWLALERSPESVEEQLYLWLRQRASAFGISIP
jgi:hypothetical protein